MLSTSLLSPPREPLSARSLLPLTWIVVSEHSSSVVVRVSIPSESGSSLFTSEVEILRDVWTWTWVDGPEVEETDLELLAEDVERWATRREARWSVSS